MQNVCINVPLLFFLQCYISYAIYKIHAIYKILQDLWQNILVVRCTIIHHSRQLHMGTNLNMSLVETLHERLPGNLLCVSDAEKVHPQLHLSSFLNFSLVVYDSI